MKTGHSLRKSAFFLLLLIALVAPVLFLTSHVEGAGGSRILSPFMKHFIAQNNGSIEKAEQLIFAINKEASSFSVLIHPLEKQGGAWKRAFPAFRATIGENGFAPFDRKKEGDGKSPTGVFALGTAFGYGPSVATGMPYRQATDNDFWVDDPASEDYNRWVSGRPKAASMEKMKREDDLYKYGIVIEYNTSPIVRGKGSAIFLHLWRDQAKGTAGCVAMPEDKVLKLLDWLDPAKKPLIIMGTEAELLGVRSP